MYKTKFLSTIFFIAAIFIHTQLAAQVKQKPLLATHNILKSTKPETLKVNYHSSQLSKSSQKEKAYTNRILAIGLDKNVSRGSIPKQHAPSITAGKQRPVYRLDNPALKINKIKP